MMSGAVPLLAAERLAEQQIAPLNLFHVHVRVRKQRSTDRFPFARAGAGGVMVWTRILQVVSAVRRQTERL